MPVEKKKSRPKPPPAAIASRSRGPAVVKDVMGATLKELARSGYGALRIEDVAVLADVNKTTVYRRWPTKPDLVRAALESMIGDVPTVPDTGSFRGDLIAMARAIHGFLRSAQGHGITRLLVAEGPQSELFAIAHSIHMSHQHLPRSVFERAVARGELGRTADGELVLEALDATIGHRCFVENMRVDEAFLERLVDLLLFGATPRAVKPPLPRRRRDR